ncbi:MAG: hypothetical protein IPL46_11155 [Saprospiraceae bacterium]|nr:hypothetical protein [Saprospiraceae bacterium]
MDAWASCHKLEDTAIINFTKKLLSPAKNDLEKIRAIYQFVTHYLTYDYAALDNNRRRINQNIYDILERKKGICWDYAALITTMADAAEMTCLSIIGFSKDLNSLKVSDQPDHAWNLVKMDSNYYLLDATWGSNTLGQTDLFKESYQSDYFLTRAELFAKNHFPSNSFFQLLDCPLTFAQFIGDSIQSNRQEDCGFNFKDSIDQFLAKSYPDQKIIESASVYHHHPNEKNQSAWGHAILDKAILLKESADYLFETGKHPGALSLYKESLSYFSDGSGKATLYRWQLEAYAFCHLNYAQVDYRLNRQSLPGIRRVAHHLREARTLLNQLNSSSIIVKNALSQIENQLAAIE